MNGLCIVVERVEWEEDGETGQSWEDRDICRVFEDYDDARDYVETDAGYHPYSLKWDGDYLYTGGVVNDDGSKERLSYNIYYVWYSPSSRKS